MPFGYSAIGGLLGQMEEAKRRMQGPLAPPPDAFQLPQQGMPQPQGAPLAPPLAPAPPSSAFANIANANVSDVNDPTHSHTRGLRGGLLHALGADKVAPEVAALLTPDQVERVKPGVIGSLWNAINYGKGPQTVMQDKANNMLALTDKKTARDKSAALARLQAAWTPIIFAARTPEEIFAAQTGYANARAAELGGENMGTTPNFLESLKPDIPDPAKPEKPDTINTASGVLQWNPQTRKYEPMVLNGKPVMPWAQPLQPSFTVPQGLVTPAGNAPVLNTKTGQWEDSGLVKADSGTGPTRRDQDLAARDAKFSFTSLLDANGKMKDPPGWKDRLATKFDWANAAASPQGQTYMKNVRNLIRSWAIIVEGKRMSDADAIANDQLKSFRFGDSAEADAMTKQRLESMAQAIKDKIGAQGASAGAAKEFKLPDGTVFRRP